MITLVSGTNRPHGLTERFSRIYFDLLKMQINDAVYFNLQSLPAEVLSTDVYEKGKRPDSILKIQDEIFIPSSKFIFIFPEYNGSFPGLLKLLIDVMDPRVAFEGKKAGLVGIATGRAGNLRGMDHLASVLHHMNVTVMPHMLPVSRVQHEFEADLLKEETLNVVKNHISRMLLF